MSRATWAMLPGIAAAVVAAAGPAGALAAQWDAGKTQPVGLTFAGRGVAWTSPTRAGGFSVFEALKRGRPRRVQSFPPPSRPNGASYVYNTAGPVGSASSSLTGLEEEQTYVPVTESGTSFDSSPLELSIGRFGYRVAPLEQCEFPVGSGLGRIAVDGEAVAFERCDGTLEVRDTSATTPPLVVGSNVRAVQLAGRYAAWLEGAYDLRSSRSEADLVVYDRTKRQEVYRIPAAAIPARIDSFGTDSNGKVALTFDPNPNDTHVEDVVAWASPSDPRLHRLHLSRGATYGVVIASGTIAFTRSGAGDHVEIGVSDLNSHVRLFTRSGAGANLDIVGRIAYPTVSGPDFNGHQIVYVVRVGRRFRIVERSVR